MHMEVGNYLDKYLIGIRHASDGKYCTGRFTGCTRTLIADFIAVSSSSFVRISSHVKGSSKRFKSGNATKSSIYFSQTNSTIPIPYNGYPFEVIATEKWICNQHSSVKKQTTNDCSTRKRKVDKGDCEASIQIRTVRVYTQFGVEKSSELTDEELRKAKDKTKTDLIELINSGQKTNCTEVNYCRFPLSSAHDHTHDCSRVTTTQLDKRVTSKIREIAKSGIYDPHSIKSMINDFVNNTLFAHAEEDEKPKTDNKRYYPSVKAIRNHVFLAVGGIRNLPDYSLKRSFNSEDMQPPSVTNVLEIPLESDTTVDTSGKRNTNVGLVAVHAGAGYHSDERWPGYKHLCSKVCSEVKKHLKLGMSAGVAATLAVQMLEDSDLTNAGMGSNLTENGNIECDASVMDTSPSSNSSNQCHSYFGSIACVSRIKNPICAAYKILDERRKRPTLELGRIPPSFLVSEGAENWSRAHGIEMCDPSDLISESSYKSWKKYHRKLVEKLASNNREHEIQNDDENSNKRLDTVGSVVLDLQGNVASAVSSGGLILKMPGRIGQAASYACGCWASPSEIGKPAVAVTTSGCGEQLVSTTIAKTCSENLRDGEQPYQVLHDTLVKDFLSSPMLSAECDKQAGLLCLHQSEDESNCTVEVVWGHTTSSMVIGHMSTNDIAPKVILSRLPDNAVPGKSVTVGGSWTKVACSNKEETESESSSSVEAEMNFNRSTDVESTEQLMSTSLSPKNDIVIQSFDGVFDENIDKEEIDSDISIMFASPLSEGISQHICHVVLSEKYNRKVDPEFEISINSNWQDRVAKNPRLFNAQKFRIHSVEYENAGDSSKFTFNLGITCYKDYMETNWSEKAEQLMKNGANHHENSQAYLSEPLGVAAIVISNDDKVVFQWRNSWLAESAGMLDVPGGHPEPCDAAGVDAKQFVTVDDMKPEDVVNEIFISQMKEVRDEVNVPLDKIGKPILTGLVRNKLSAGRPVAYFYMRCNMSSEEMLQQYNKGGPETDESTKLQFIPLKDILNLKQDQPDLWARMCPNGKAACTLYSMLKRKQADLVASSNHPP